MIDARVRSDDGRDDEMRRLRLGAETDAIAVDVQRRRVLEPSDAGHWVTFDRAVELSGGAHVSRGAAGLQVDGDRRVDQKPEPRSLLADGVVRRANIVTRVLSADFVEREESDVRLTIRGQRSQLSILLFLIPSECGNWKSLRGAGQPRAVMRPFELNVIRGLT